MEASVSTQLFGARQVAGPKSLQTSSVAVLGELTLHRETQRQRVGWSSIGAVPGADCLLDTEGRANPFCVMSGGWQRPVERWHHAGAGISLAESWVR